MQETASKSETQGIEVEQSQKSRQKRPEETVEIP